MAYINGNKIPAILRKGDKGDNAFIRYSAYADGTDFTKEWSEGQNYIGFATGQTAPTDKNAYQWVKCVNEPMALVFTDDGDGNVTAGMNTADAELKITEYENGHIIMGVN